MSTLKKAELHLRCHKCHVDDNYRVGEEVEGFTCYGYIDRINKTMDTESNGYDFCIIKPIFRCMSCGAIIPYTEEMQKSYHKMVENLIGKDTKSKNPFHIEWMVHDDLIREKTGEQRMVCHCRQTDGALDEPQLKEEFVKILWDVIQEVSGEAEYEIDDKIVKFVSRLLHRMEFGHNESKLSPCYKLIPQPSIYELQYAKRAMSKYHSKLEIDILNHELWKLFLERDPRIIRKDR